MEININLIIFILAASTLFPMAGYYLDYRKKKKSYKARENQKNKSI
ncbi:hypothetical protein BC781_10563 [Sediminitomix flava]|uniref:Uncharacterized protein n=1 Tax=Sediminitomix flava TaxID=379075 RepID=A0A315Z8H7_SEDFL|nr:hypothetical protein BC781_10563 [Sediminitomix flava]